MVTSKLTEAIIAEAIAVFARDLKNSLDMADKKMTVKWLADAIGATKANQVAEVFGLISSYYKVTNEASNPQLHQK